MLTSWYDPTKTYEENYTEGPFDDLGFDAGEPKGEPAHDFLGHKVYAPFGIPAGPLLNSAYVSAAFRSGFDIAVYKTVRSDVFPCHPFPNVLAVHVGGDLTLEQAKKPLVADVDYRAPLSITNSFGVPSRSPEVWQADARRAIASAGKGQVMVLSCMGTVREGQTPEEFIADYALAARLASETEAPIIEINLSCPNIGNEGLVCYNIEMTERVSQAVREVIDDTPLILKVGYYEDADSIARLIDVAGRYAQSISAINTVQATIIDVDGAQALPGPNRSKSGVCGTSIKWAGLAMTERLAKAREHVGAPLSIIGVGGVMTVDDYRQYRDAGADAVMSATGAMWNAHLGEEIRAII